MSEEGRRLVLITRPEPDATETARLVAAMGWEPVLAPMLVLLQGQVLTHAPFDAIVVGSRHAVAALPAWYRHLPVLAVGSATAARARTAGFAAVLDADGDGRALAALARSTLKGGERLLLVHARGQGQALAARLEEAGFVVERQEGYAMSAAPAFPEAAAAALGQDRVRAATFLSAETARAFVRLMPDRLRSHLDHVEAVAIGTAAAEALAPLPWRRVRVSLKPSLDHVLALL